MSTIDDKIGNGREYRAMPVMEIRTEAETDSSKIVEGYATTFDEPYLLYSEDGYEVWEKVDRNAFAETDMSDVIMQYNHEGRVFARTRNNTLVVSPDEKGLAIKADLGGTDIGRQLYQEIAGGYTDKMSFGFTVQNDARETERLEDKTVITRTILGIGKLYDVSAVSVPANDGTAISARSFCNGVIAEAKAERLEAEKREAAKKRLALKIKLLEGGK